MKPVTLIGPGLAMIGVTYGLARYSYGLFLPNMREEFNLSLAILGIIASSSYLSYMLAALIVPYLIGRCGPKLPVALGGICAMLGMAIIGIAESPWVLLAGVVIAGASPGFAYPPMPDAVSLLIEKNLQSKTLSWINSGTSFGVMLAGSISLFASENWRMAWIVFSGISLGVTLWNTKILPGVIKEKKQKQEVRTSNRTVFKQYQVCILFLFSFVLGLAVSVYWTFAVDLIAQQAGFSSSIGKIFWILVGISGVGGAFAGNLLERYGMASVLRGSILGLAISIAALPLDPNWFVIVFSAIVFGSTFNIITGVFGVWCIQIHPKRPSVCFGPSLFLISAGQFIGPIVMGLIAEWVELTLTFYTAAGMMILLLFFRLQEKNAVCSKHEVG